MINPADFPSPQTTLVIVLGASQWPYDEVFEASKAFEQAASKLKTYFLNTFGLPQSNLLWLFDTPLNERDIDKEICKHLDNFGEKARDVLVYYTGHGRPTDDRSSLYLAIRDTQAHDPESSSLRFKSLAKTLKAKARRLRRFYILDCCFAALGQNTLQGASVFDTLCQRTLEDVEIPLQGYAGLFSSGKEEMSVILPTHDNTFFTEAFLQVLLEGSPYQGQYLSLKDIYALVEKRVISLYREYHLKYPQTYKPPKPQLYAGDVASIPFFPNPHAEAVRPHKTEAERRRKMEVKRRRKARRRKAAEGGAREDKNQQLVPLPGEQREREDPENTDVINLPATDVQGTSGTTIEHTPEQITRSNRIIRATFVETSEREVGQEKADPTSNVPIDIARLIQLSQREAERGKEPSSTFESAQGESKAVYQGNVDMGVLNQPKVSSQTPRTAHSAHKSTRQSGRLRSRKLQPPPGRPRYTPRPEISSRDKEENLRATSAKSEIPRPVPRAPRPSSIPDFDTEEAFFEAFRRGAENAHASPKTTQKQSKRRGRLTQKLPPSPGRAQLTPARERQDFEEEEDFPPPRVPSSAVRYGQRPTRQSVYPPRSTGKFPSFTSGSQRTANRDEKEEFQEPLKRPEPTLGRHRPEIPDLDEEEQFREVPRRASRQMRAPRPKMPEPDKEKVLRRSAAEDLQVIATPPGKKKVDFKKAVDFFFGKKTGTRSTTSQSIDTTSTTQTERQLYTALRIGTTSVVAIIVEVVDDIGVVLGVGRHQQSSAHMSDGIVTDIAGVIATCNEPLLQAEEAAGGVIAPNAVIGIAGELVKGSTITVSKRRTYPMRPITPDELESMISSAQIKLLKNAKEPIASETGYNNIEIRLTNAAVISVSIDGQRVYNPIGFRGQDFTLTLFSAFAPLMQLGALETVTQGLDLTLVTIAAEPYALAKCLSHNASTDSGAIFIDIGGSMTDIVLVRQGGIEDTRMFALGGRVLTRRLASRKGLPLKNAEQLKINYSLGNVKRAERDEIQQILAPEVTTWMDSVEILIEELAKGELLPPAIYLTGGGSGLPDLIEKLKSFPWTERLPFAHEPIIQTIQPEMVTSISDPNRLLKTAQDITPMALAYQAIEIQIAEEDNVLEKALSQVIHNMRI